MSFPVFYIFLLGMILAGAWRPWQERFSCTKKRAGSSRRKTAIIAPMTQSALFPDSPPQAPDPARKVDVLVPYPVDRAYSYYVPEGMDVAPGDYVIVPLGSREVPGVVWDQAPDANKKSAKIKNIIARCDAPPLSAVQRRFVDWLAQYTMSTRGFVLKMVLSTPAALEPPKAVNGYKITDFAARILAGGEADKTLRNLSPQRRNVLRVLSDGTPARASEIAERAGCTPAVVKGLLDTGLIEQVDLYSAAPCRNPDIHRPGPVLSADQAKAAAHMCDAVQAGAYHAALLDGVTGAGKTEVYFEAVAEAVKAGKQVLLMLPEIALSNAFLARFRERFGCAPALWHSHLSAGQRRATWRGVAEGHTKVVVGARSALFLPYADLGLIIVDEEHDPAYKQEDGVIYHARDMAVVRAHLGKIPIMLVSATPSLETFANVWAGRYAHLRLPDRHGGASLPEMRIIDMKIDKPERQHFISPILKDAIQSTIEAGEQALLFLNRRGYAPLTLCRTCGHRIDCPRCTAWLVEHKKSGRLHCHHCGYNTPFPKACPSCGDADSLAACGPGVERVMEEVKTLFPAARTVILASDTAESQSELKALLQDIRDHKYDIIIGTQIIAKGHHFPKLTCVGVVDADLGLNGGDLRAAERTYQLLHQVAGRAGREELPGRVYLQSFFPDNKVMQALAAHERDYFMEVESDERERAHMPPFSRLVGIIVAGKDEKQVMEMATSLGKCAPQGEGIQTLGPAEAAFYRLRGYYRRRLLVRADKNINVQSAIQQWLAQVKIPSTVRVYVDIDPQSFL